MFARFVPEAVVTEVLAETGDGLRLGGVRRTCTVMFSDLRGFTTFSETRSAEEVLKILNRYLTAMTDAILAHGGTLVSYMGDGIMAIFGAPLAQPDHADRALAAAGEMLDSRLRGFNNWMRSEGLSDGFRMGIGLHSGDVMAGNVGSEQRLEYTAIGDVTNTASRIEGLTKGTPHMLFVADSTVSMLTRPVPDLVFVDEFEIRGREGRIRLWTLPGDDIEPAEAVPASAHA
jgi:adenylate cyclase